MKPATPSEDKSAEQELLLARVASWLLVATGYYMKVTYTEF